MQRKHSLRSEGAPESGRVFNAGIITVADPEVSPLATFSLPLRGITFSKLAYFISSSSTSLVP
jgi:hypothetical protein